MGIPAPGNSRALEQSAFSEDVLKIELCGPSKPHLSVIDVPGIFRTPTEGLTTKEDMSMVRRMVHRYIENSRTIILAVIPANVDIATQEILTMAADVDPSGQRTLGVITKPDLVDKGAEQDVVDLVLGRRNRLRLGYFIVRNRGQQDKSTSAEDRHRQEAEFFSSSPWSSDKSRVGIFTMKARLIELLNEITRREYPRVDQEIARQLTERERELSSLGPGRETHEQQRKYLLDISTKFQEITTYALEARYARNTLFHDNANLRLATMLVDLNERFANDMEKKGHTVQFSNSSPTTEDVPAAAPIAGTPIAKCSPAPILKNGIVAAMANKPSADVSLSFGFRGEYPELSDVIQESWQCPLPLDDDIFDWIERKYKESRGFELGTFNPSILSTLFQDQTSKWAGLTEGYISDAISSVHKFIDALLSALCSDEQVKLNLWTFMLDELIGRYKKTMEHVKFVVRTEREGTLLTLNNNFNKNLQKARMERLVTNVRSHATTVYDADRGHPHSAVHVDKIFRSVPMGNLEHTVGDIHNILKAYYEVARERFVDTICTQGLDYHLLSGSDTPLRVLSPNFVVELRPEQLEMIAGEDTVSISRRAALKKEIESLLDGKRLLRG